MCSMNHKQSCPHRVFSTTAWSVSEPLVTVTLPLAHCLVVCSLGSYVQWESRLRNIGLKKYWAWIQDTCMCSKCAIWLNFRWVVEIQFFSTFYSYSSRPTWPTFKYQLISFYLSKLPIFREFALSFGRSWFKKWNNRLSIVVYHSVQSRVQNLILDIRGKEGSLKLLQWGEGLNYS